MSRRRTTKDHIRNIQKSRGGYYINLPIGIIKSLKWQERQKVTVKRKGKKIIIADWKK